MAIEKLEMKTTNSIKYVIDVNNEKHNYKINIRLNDECRNGHEDFAMTADFWLPNNEIIIQKKIKKRFGF